MTLPAFRNTLPGSYLDYFHHSLPEMLDIMELYIESDPVCTLPVVDAYLALDKGNINGLRRAHLAVRNAVVKSMADDIRERFLQGGSSRMSVCR
ncbi:hypothetical protein HJFPF1_05084 [Paramyrothecium foliicola]|nr:hypothetical protein HJFPF1_05084 [Paramyrothecium foliicola]